MTQVLTTKNELNRLVNILAPKETEMKNLDEMTRTELEKEFSEYVFNKGLDREAGYDFEECFSDWLDENEIELED